MASRRMGYIQRQVVQRHIQLCSRLFVFEPSKPARCKSLDPPLCRWKGLVHSTVSSSSLPTVTITIPDTSILSSQVSFVSPLLRVRRNLLGMWILMRLLKWLLSSHLSLVGWGQWQLPWCWKTHWMLLLVFTQRWISEEVQILCSFFLYHHLYSLAFW